MNNPVMVQSTYTPDRLIAGPSQILSEEVTIFTGENLVRGALVGKITATGKYILSLSAAADGSQIPAGVIAGDVDATAADKPAVMYTAGEFNEDEMTIGTAHTADTVRDGLRDKGIHLRKPVGA
jgi:hypothetical protein